MINFRYTYLSVSIIVIVVGLFFGCSNPNNIAELTKPYVTKPYVIDIAAIPGVTAPAGGALPVTSITETDQYTGKVSWDPADDPFDYSTAYTATITLTAKSGYTLTGITAGFFTVAGADTVTHDADSGLVTVVFPATGIPPVVGDRGPAGGLIFYIDETDLYDWTYLEVAPKTTEWEIKEWGDNGTEIGGDAQLTDIGDGQAATDAIVSHMEGKSITGTAAQLCDGLEHEHERATYKDWFLPSVDELNKIYENLHDIATPVGEFDGKYWTSSENFFSAAYLQNFDDGAKDYLTKDSDLSVRAVRTY